MTERSKGERNAEKRAEEVDNRFKKLVYGMGRDPISKMTTLLLAELFEIEKRLIEVAE